ncbi:MAG TPA: toast rack family protein [Candidatus Eremiobacteraceae bacterium]|nr:toast rack family protein [Candidatus Eremiobacteraceae bacterium]
MKQDQAARHVSLVVPILLIAVGSLFLYSNWKPAFDPIPVLTTYWPALLIFVGIGMFWDSLRRSRVPASTPPFPLGSTLGAIFFALLLVVLLRHHSQSPVMGANSQNVSHINETLDRKGETALRADLRMGAGQIIIRGGTARLFEGDFQFGSAHQKPRVDYHISNGSGDLSITQDQTSTPMFGNSKNDWNLRFPGDLPLELNIDLGAGKEDLQFRDMRLQKLYLKVGAGEVDVDLTGQRSHDLYADIEGGVGQANIRLPRNVGVSVQASGGIGAIDTNGLKNKDGQYVNDSYGKTAATIRLTIHGGIGAIRLTQDH